VTNATRAEAAAGSRIRFAGARLALDRPDAGSGIFPSDDRAVATTLVLD